MEKLIRVFEGITAALWAITILYSIFLFSLGGFLLNDILQDILISLITGSISSLVITLISYFTFLHKIPEKTYEKIEKLLNDRLGYETTNHNAVMGALNPNNEFLLNLVSKDHRELKTLTGVRRRNAEPYRKRAEKAAKENREHILTDAEKEIDKHIESLRAFSDIMVKQQEKIAQLEKENVDLKEQIQNLNAQLNQQPEQSQYYGHENEQDFGMYL